MMQQIPAYDLEHVYANAVNTIQHQMNFVDAVKELEEAARAGHGKVAVIFSRALLSRFPRRTRFPKSTVLAKDGHITSITKRRLGGVFLRLFFIL